MRCSCRIQSKLKILFFSKNMLILSGDKSIKLESLCRATLSKANNVLAYRSRTCEDRPACRLSKGDEHPGISRTNQERIELFPTWRNTGTRRLEAYIYSWPTTDLLISKNPAASFPLLLQSPATLPNSKWPFPSAFQQPLTSFSG